MVSYFIMCAGQKGFTQVVVIMTAVVVAAVGSSVWSSWSVRKPVMQNTPQAQHSAVGAKTATTTRAGAKRVKTEVRGTQPLPRKQTPTQSGYWTEWETGFKPVGAVPACPNPLLIPPPADLSKVTSVLYPGQYRGGEYKAHGGFRFDNNPTNEVAVRIPLDADLIYGSRYIQSDEVQYLFGFRMSCGIEYRFDHIRTLAPRFQSRVDALLPPPKLDDSRTTEFRPPIPVRAGELLATEVGFSNPRNVGFDFGVYDLRMKNKKARDPVWSAARKDNSLAPYAVCWLDWFAPKDRQLLRSLPGADWRSGAQSDYCE